MSEAKFTPGPWEWVKSKNDNWSSYDLSPGILTKDTADGTTFGDEIDRANASLIAAAPDLYEALEAAIEEINHLRKFAGDNGAMIDDTDFVEGIAALAKARGEV